MPKSKLLALVISRLLMGLGMFMLLFFLPAGTWNYWLAWMFLGVYSSPCCLCWHI